MSKLAPAAIALNERLSAQYGSDVLGWLKSHHAAHNKGKPYHPLAQHLALEKIEKNGAPDWMIQTIAAEAKAQAVVMLAPQGESKATVPAPAAQQSRPSLKQLRQFASEVFPMHINTAAREGELFSQCERVAFQNHIRFPGMSSDAALAEKYYRPETSRIVGNWKHLRAMQQAKADAIFAVNNQKQK